MKMTIQRTLEKCRRHGWLAQSVQFWNPHTRQRKDLFGLIDVLALRGASIVSIQACGTDVAKHLKKIKEHPDIRRILRSDLGFNFQIWSWRKKKRKRGGKAVRWVVKRICITLSDEEEIIDFELPEDFPPHEADYHAEE